MLVAESDSITFVDTSELNDYILRISAIIPSDIHQITQLQRKQHKAKWI